MLFFAYIFIFFASRVINIPNSLPQSTDCSSISAFKRSIYSRTLLIFLSFYRAMLCIRGTSHGPVSVRLSVRPSQVGVLLKRLNVGLHKQHHTVTRAISTLWT